MNPDFEPVRFEALDWASRFAIGPVSDADRLEFDDWRAASPAHAEAFEAAAQFIEDLRAADLPRDRARFANDNVSTADGGEARLNRRAFLGGSAVAASIAAGVIAAQSPLGLWPTLAELLAEERTGMGERRRLTPMAGVEIEMNARSSLSHLDNGVRLIAGEIFVAVAEQGGPFRVEANGMTSIARSAQFNVNVLDHELCVTCLDGRLSAERAGTNVRLQAGEAVTFLADGTLQQAKADREAVTGWRSGLLMFKGTPLASAIGEINRYYPGRLVLRGSTLNNFPITGVFRVNQIELAVVQVQQLTGVSATRLPGGVVLLG
ncbi:DUF4880 domain-containing protein [Sandaracinobacter sp. RS1-74]|uniref:FecR family protein n=1 Tax=Sandaracinobacteroides sayramensis TaxID=2913411 RepID=UPI001EDC74FC|nr:FecR domain-containing protein [Sandaracinobacteroides sayramensis]MCG2841832.1 DUF4880 domain-containing protein [Sandaracinobacteroides sayramensis]